MLIVTRSYPGPRSGTFFKVLQKKNGNLYSPFHHCPYPDCGPLPPIAERYSITYTISDGQGGTSTSTRYSIDFVTHGYHVCPNAKEALRLGTVLHSCPAVVYAVHGEEHNFLAAGHWYDGNRNRPSLAFTQIDVLNPYTGND